MPYDNAVYGLKLRKWFGRPKLYGGDVLVTATTFLLNTGVITTAIASWYPGRPIKLHKFGVLAHVACDTAPPDADQNVFRLTSPTQASIVATISINNLAKNAIASKAVVASLGMMDEGEPCAIKISTALTSLGTDVASLCGGSVAFFIDYSPRYTSTSDDAWID